VPAAVQKDEGSTQLQAFVEHGLRRQLGLVESAAVSETPIWKIPSGNQCHAKVVGIITLFVGTFLAAAFLHQIIC
jgi:hypothetical protein